MKTYAPGTLIAGRYEVASRPLMGGMGIVYICLDHQEDRPVALKTFKPEYLPDRAARDRFLREGTHWVDLGVHPHIVRCYRVFQPENAIEVYLVLELVAKEQGYPDASLRSWLTPGRPLPLDQAILFALQIAHGMAYATTTIPGFVHRDLKPENILVGADHLPNAAPLTQGAPNRLRVTDFGLARAATVGEALPPLDNAQPLPERPGLTRVGAVLGTPPYMAPEQWEGADVDVRADIYALGCIVGEMLTGRRLVEERTLQGFKRAHREGRAGQVVARLPEAVSATVAGCLAIDPAARYPDWEAVTAALTTAYETSTGQPAPSPTPSAALTRAERVAAGWSYSEMGVSYLDIGKAEVAIGYFERAREAGEVEGERGLQGAALGNLGNASADLGAARRAIGFYEQALAIERKIGDRHVEGNTLSNLGNTYAALGDAHRAIGFYEQALALHREIGDRHGEGNTLSNLGLAYADSGEVWCAIGDYEQALTIAREIGDRRGEGNALGNLGIAHFTLGDARRAIGFYEQHIEITREIGDRRGEGAELSNLGVAYADLGDVHRAIGYHEQALAIAREIGDRQGEGTALDNLGLAYKDLRDARRAIEFYEQALEIAREISDRRGEGNALGNLGLAYKDLRDARRAIKFYKQQLVIVREIGDRRGEGNALGNLGVAYTVLGDTRRAIKHYKQALAIDREIGDIAGVADTSFNMALLYTQQSETTRAVPLAQEATRIYTQIGHAEYAQHAQGLVAQLQKGTHLTTGPSPTQILQQFASIIEAVVAAAHGHRQARAAVEVTLDGLEQRGWRIADSIHRIWQGEHDASTLTAGIDANSALIIREILNQLGH